MSRFDTAPDVLAALTEQGLALDPATTRQAVADVERLRAEYVRLADEGYKPLVLRERQSAAAATTIDTGAALLRAIDLAGAQQATEAREAHDRDQHARLAATNGHGVDASWFTATMSTAEVSAKLQDALALGTDEARRAWAFAKPLLDAKARQEFREHRLPGQITAFNALTTWGARVAALPSAQHAQAAQAWRTRQLRETVLAIYDVVGLRHAVERAARRSVLEASGPAPSGAGGLVMGKFFDQFKPR